MNSLKIVRNAVIVLCVIAVFSSNLGCDDSSGEKGAIKALIMKNAQTCEDENISGYMSTIHPDSAAYGTTKDIMSEMFGVYKLKYDVKSVKVLSVKDDEARVRVRMITSKISGPEFADNDLTAVHVLRKDGSEWKIYESIIEKVDYV